MVNELFEAVPNVSEGRDQKKIDSFAKAIKVGGASLLDYSADVDHNRSVYTIVGTKLQLKNSLLNLADEVIKKIDMHQHNGVHPCVGALDVLPIVPLKNVSMSQAENFAMQMANLLWEKFSLPSFFYNYQQGGNLLANFRKSGFAGLSACRFSVGDKPHPTAGAVAISARHLMIAFNVNLLGADLSLAKKIARQIRESNGGFVGVKALGLFLPQQKKVQVSMNLIDYHKTSLRKVYEKIASLVQGMDIDLQVELIGVLPADALSSEDILAFGLSEKEVKTL